MPPHEAGDDAIGEGANGGAAEHGSQHGSGPVVRTFVGPLRALTVHHGGELSPEGASAVPAVVHEPTDAPVRTWVGPVRSPGRQPGGVVAPAGGESLDAVHAPTVRVVHQLRQARHKLQRNAAPALQLSPAIRALWRTEMRLDRPLRVAVCGEINSGKSSLANLLAGIESLPTAILSNTRIPTLLYYAAQPEIWTVDPGGRRARLRSDQGMPRGEIFRVDVGLPSERLRAVQIVDLPGVVDPRSGLPEIDLLSHHVDAAIWCTMSTQAWKESERTAWSLLPPRVGNRGILVATHRDLLRDDSDQQKLLGRLRHEVGGSFASIVLVSTAEALAVMGKDRSGPDGAAWIASGAAALESALGGLLMRLREQRAAAALRMTSRVAHHALMRIEQATGAGGA